MNALKIPSLSYKIDVIREEFRLYNEDEKANVKSFAINYSQCDPNFFRWLYGYENTETLSDYEDPSPDETIRFFNSL